MIKNWVGLVLEELTCHMLLIISMSAFFLVACERFEPERQFVVTIDEVTDVTSNSCLVKGYIHDTGEEGILNYGLCWSTGSGPDINDDTIQIGLNPQPGYFSGIIPGLSSSTEYHIKPYGTASGKTYYGNEKQIQTQQADIPSVTTSGAESVADKSANVRGEVINDGGAVINERGFYYGSSGNPVSTGVKIALGGSNGAFSTTISGLLTGTTYYYVAYAINSAGTGFGEELSFETADGTLTDIDGNTYSFVQIGDQTWMQENLYVTHFADGTPIQPVQDSIAWDELDYPDKGYCWYDNNISYRAIYGAIYTWAAAMNGESSSDANPSGIQGVCPDGWHLPSDAEWKQLEVYLGMNQSEADKTGWRGTDEGGKLKEEGYSHWMSPNTGATNSSHFTALPGGHRNYLGEFSEMGGSAGFWSSTEGTSTNAWIRYLPRLTSQVVRYPYAKDNGFSVRCIQN